MTVEQYLKSFRRHLGKMPANEKNDVAAYYEEYFQEMGLGPDDEVPSDMNSPRSLAYEIRRNQKAESLTEDRLPRPWKIAGLAVLGILALPVGLPVAVTLLAGVIALGATLLAIFGALVATLFARGYVSIITLTTEPIFSALWFSQLGILLMCMALSVLLVLALIQIGRLIVRAIQERGNQRREA